MRKFLATAAAFLSAVAMNAQGGYVPSASDYDNFANTKTLVVLDDNILSDFNIAIKEDMKNEWPSKNFGFINRKDFETKRSDPSYSFLLTTTVTYPEDKIKARYVYLSLLMGKDKVKVKDMPDLISIPLAYSNVVDQNYVYKLPAFIRFVLRHVELIKSDPKLISKTPLLYYNKNCKSLKNKTIYLVKSDLQKTIQTEAAIKKFSGLNNIKIVSEEEVRKAIEERRKDVVFLHKVGPEKANSKTRCFKMLIGADDADVYYFDYHLIDGKTPDALLEKDLKKIAKEMK